MREGPLAELFRATEAAQRRSSEDDLPAADAVAEEPPFEPAVDPPAPTPLPTREPEREPAPAAHHEPDRPSARWLDPLPANPARLERARESTSYLAVIRVVGV